MGAYGLFVICKAIWAFMGNAIPEAFIMGWVGLLALIANVSVAILLFAYRNGDANMRSVWLCTRNDAIGNFAIMLAAFGVFGTGNAWPDLCVALIMGALALSASYIVIQHSRQELRQSELIRD